MSSPAATVDPLARLRAFPRAPAPNDDPTSVKTNFPQDDVVLNQNILAYHIGHHPDSKVFGHAQAGHLKLIELHARDRRDASTPANVSALDGISSANLEAVTVCELTVTEDMLNVHGTFAGPCAVSIMDLCTFSSLFALSTLIGTDASGFSASMNVVWHNVATKGTTLRFVSTSMTAKGRTTSARCEAYDKKRGTLVVSATQLITPVPLGLPTGARARAALKAKL
ncbi:uncharacterized protein BXZ73DRAFT_105739 [Epithele typhae]|uniref:uncharacterized protein n=1 Tax=Epithele typhae TaxID=378194 RepID=UPI002008792E|nr:uncharacterized protein BXZ73DRAFT_105739 [Epithele typhae]KAH9916761.1 hypothetical protein BXZ73DRAFT_105739 [Epithele typhae]